MDWILDFLIEARLQTFLSAWIGRVLEVVIEPRRG